MDEVVEFCAGLDVHRDTVVATVRFPQGRQRGSETKTFGTDTAELVALGDWLISHRVTRVGLESTGVYWKPVFYLLEDRIEQLWLLNAQHLKNVPGRKTDVVEPGSRSWSSTGWYGPRSCRRHRLESCVISPGTAGCSARNAPGWCSGWRRCCRMRGSS